MAIGLRNTVALLDVDPDLATDLNPNEEEEARRRAVAAVLELEAPDWDPSPVREAAEPGWLGLYLVEGLMVRRVSVGKRHACELLGPGDLFRPWDADGEYEPLPITVSWLVLEPTRLAALDTAFAMRVARWPSISSRIVGRVAQRARYLALIQAVTHLRRVYARLLILFWLLGERWGRMGPQGVRVSLPLTHEVLAMVVGAHRPTVSIALRRLAQAELLIRERPDRWLLTARATEMLGNPESLLIANHEAGEAGDEQDELSAAASRSAAHALTEPE